MKTGILLSLIAVLLLSGCATYTTTTTEGRTTVDIQNSGWYLFNCIPLGSGEPDRPNKADCRMFSDSVTLDNNMKLLRQAMVDEKAYKAENVTSHWTDEKVLLILLKRYACHTSAELIK